MSFLDVFKKGLQKTATTISRTVSGLFTEVKKWDEGTFKMLEDALVASDLGIAAAKKIVDDLRDKYQRGLLNGTQDILQVARDNMVAMLRSGARPLHMNPDGLTVILMVGVNGSGKTTTAGKLAFLWSSRGKKVVLGACDTFRAAAVEQLKLWGEKTSSTVIASKTGADSASVAYDAVSAALARKADILIIDTAGRQQNQKWLMDELSKILRIIRKLAPDAPHETLLTIDASIGINAISQAREFAAVSGASALVLTKLDGTGKGGAAAAIEEEFHLPVLFVGLGEAPDDLQEFSPEEYCDAIFFGESAH
ncbi:MAG: signal recognition particle-docking protein FtsY [Lentisphaeria bacterium]|nr:signal recognition particle-docking protein FtsY [Lentisphaeria bacterium]